VRFVGQSDRLCLVTAKDVKGSLGYAVWKDDLADVRRILAQGNHVDDDAWGKGVKTPLMESLDEIEAFYDDGRRAITTTLLEHGADVHRRDDGGRVPLHYAAGVGGAAVELLINAGADINAQSADGSTPLHVAASRGSVTAVESLLRAGADQILLDSQGRTARDLLPQDPRKDDEEDSAIRSRLDSAGS
jgi:ankyrin repeat protein